MGEYFDLTQTHFKLESDSSRFHYGCGIKLALQQMLGGGQNVSSGCGFLLLLLFLNFIKTYRSGCVCVALFPVTPFPSLSLQTVISLFLVILNYKLHIAYNLSL